ncbi:MAG TPA: rhodanese-like domain-containing protein [Candidatus Krumholzibacteria bacterium]|nr:rhodanese-like domain-containing protein [Candidatus Krumholzibacteria bacterium]
MRNVFPEILGGLGVIVVASLLGIVVNAVRPNGVALIQSGEPVSTAQHGATADSAAADTTHALAEGAISLAEMKRLFDAGTAIILDARDPAEYEQGHIPGAINIPYDRIPEYFDVLQSQVPMDAHVVVYCRSLTCDFSDQLATELKIIGYQNISIFSGGWDQWSTAGYPIEGMVDK